jgi:ferric-dicitrate binding protein FerR (iron transport regulator)
VSAFVSSYSGTIAVVNSAGNTLSLTGELSSGDTISVGTGSTALLHISDGSELSLGSAMSETKLELSTLTYNDDNNLASKVSLLLSLGEVWVEAPHLRTETDSTSDLSVQTDSALAAVRGTVFGVSKNALGATQLSLASGKIEVAKLTNGYQSMFYNGFSSTASTGFVLQSGIGSSPKSFMII